MYTARVLNPKLPVELPMFATGLGRCPRAALRTAHYGTAVFGGWGSSGIVGGLDARVLEHHMIH